MFQLRIYTLRSPDALQRYATVHWARHLPTFETFGIRTHGVWTERSGGANRLVALIRYPPDIDPEPLTRHIMASPEFAADMDGFDVDEIVDVQSIPLDPSVIFTDTPGAFDMTTMTIAYVLAGVIAAAIIFIGARFIVAPRVAAVGYGVPSDGAYMRVKGVRDIASGLFVFILMAAGTTHLLGWVILAATIIPLADTAIVLRSGGAKSIAWGVHGVTAVVMVATSALLLIS